MNVSKCCASIIGWPRRLGAYVILEPALDAKLLHNQSWKTVPLADDAVGEASGLEIGFAWPLLDELSHRGVEPCPILHQVHQTGEAMGDADHCREHQQTPHHLLHHAFGFWREPWTTRRFGGTAGGTLDRRRKPGRRHRKPRGDRTNRPRVWQTIMSAGRRFRKPPGDRTPNRTSLLANELRRCFDQSLSIPKRCRHEPL